MLKKKICAKKISFSFINYWQNSNYSSVANQIKLKLRNKICAKISFKVAQVHIRISIRIFAVS